MFTTAWVLESLTDTPYSLAIEAPSNRETTASSETDAFPKGCSQDPAR